MGGENSTPYVETEQGWVSDDYVKTENTGSVPDVPSPKRNSIPIIKGEAIHRIASPFRFWISPKSLNVISEFGDRLLAITVCASRPDLHGGKLWRESTLVGKMDTCFRRYDNFSGHKLSVTIV